MELNKLTAHELIELISQKKASVEDILKDALKEIDKKDKKINAFVFLDKNIINNRLNEINGAKNGKLFGIPIAIKDNICVKGENTTCASKILKDFKPPYNATVIEKIEKEGAIILGKTNMDEFAFGSSCETSCYFTTKNPWDLKRIPGGSSGGSAAAVSADETILALGSDTGGSIRQPAALCGVVGLKPTYGRVSRYGLIAFASSLDQIGPFSKDVRDSALLMNVISGYDPKDSTSANLPIPDYTKSLVNDVKGLKIAIPKEYFQASPTGGQEGLNEEIKNSVFDAIKLLEKMGAKSKEVSLPHTKYAVSVYYIIATAEASSNLARFDGVQYGLREKAGNLLDMYENTRGNGFGDEAKRRIILGTFALSSGYYDAYYLKAQKVRTLIKRDFDNVFKDFDCIITPTSPTPAFKIGEKIDDPISMYLSDIYTISANLAGIPAISIPCGFTKNNLPIGLQIMAKPFAEETIFRIAYSFEQNTEYHKRKL